MDSTHMQALKLAESGHNILITGSPGTGKTYTMGILIERLKMCGRAVNVTASTGKAATVLRQQCKVNVTTIHRFMGLRDGRYSNEELLTLLKNSEVFVRQKENIEKSQTLIIDEVSMISVKMLDQIEFICRNIKDVTKPFGGMQMIFAGDFYQLPPVPNIGYGDDGAIMIGSKLLDIFHHINLVNIHRQDEPDFIKAIHEISRSLPPGEDPVRLFATNLDVDICNSESLLKMEGEDKVYVSEDEGDVNNIQGRDRLHLKVGCPVILIVNLSDELVNGLDGIIRELKDKSAVCFFPSLQRQEEIYKYHFKKYSVELRKDIGCRVQLPLKLGFAITVHKAQGMTLDRVKIDCRGMFQYGQLAVAISRATKIKGLQILNFSRNLVRKPPDILRKFYEKKEVSVSEDLSCCVKSQAQTDVPVTPDINLYIQVVGTNIGDEEVDEIDLQSGDEAEFIEMIESVEKTYPTKKLNTLFLRS